MKQSQETGFTSGFFATLAVLMEVILSDPDMSNTMSVIARVHTDFHSKFGIPRQSGIIESIKASIIFEPKFRNPDAIRGLEGFSYIWLIWKFSESRKECWSPMVRPPRLGGSKKMGVFATRSPFRPNGIGLSSVKLSHIEFSSALGPVIHILGADLMDNTPIFDIKPYLPYTDDHQDAKGGFTDTNEYAKLSVLFPPELQYAIPQNIVFEIIKILENDPRPHYHDDPERIYGFEYNAYEIKFSVNGTTLTVREVCTLQ